MGLFQLSPAPFNPIELARGAIRMFAADASQRGVKLDFTVDSSVEALNATSIVADASRLAQVLINFMTNALRYSAESNGQRVSVNVSAVNTLPAARAEVMRVAASNLVEQTVNGVWLIVQVTDTGPGLGPDEMSKLFHRFAQANPQIDSLSGFGLGLFVSRKIVELHEGVIEVRMARDGRLTVRRSTRRAARARPSASSCLRQDQLSPSSRLRSQLRRTPSPSSGRTRRQSRPSRRRSSSPAITSAGS